MAGLATTEGDGQDDMSLPKNKCTCIDALTDIKDRAVTVFKDGDPLLMPGLDRSHTLVSCFNHG